MANFGEPLPVTIQDKNLENPIEIFLEMVRQESLPVRQAGLLVVNEPAPLLLSREPLVGWAASFSTHERDVISRKAKNESSLIQTT